MTSAQNVIPVSFPRPRLQGKAKSAKPAAPVSYESAQKSKAKTHPDRLLIDACVRYCAAAATTEAAFSCDPTDAFFAAPVDCERMRECDAHAIRATRLKATTVDGLSAKGSVALIITSDPQNLLTEGEVSFLKQFARDVIALRRATKNSAQRFLINSS